METVFKIKILKEKIAKNDIQLKNLLKEISECQDDLQKFNTLNSEISFKLNDIRQEIMDFKRFIQIIEDPDLKYNMEKDLECIQNQFELNVAFSRKAVLNTQRVINSNARTKLFEYSNKLRNRLDPSRNKEVNNEIMANQASDLSDNLHSLSRLLANEVEKSEKNLETLISSSALATETTEELKTMSNYVANSKTLLSKYGRREMTDKLLTILALLFFFGCVIYVVIKRI